MPAPSREVPYLGSLDLRLPVSLERMYENALDWEHLPFVHASSFASIRKIDAGDWGWLADAELPGEEPLETIRIELRLERERHRWITRTLEGSGAGSEVWTHVTPLAEREIQLVIDFFAPSQTEAHAKKRFAQYDALYRQLYDEDLAMMLDRQDGIEERAPAAEEGDVDIGSAERVRAALPFVATAFGRRWRIVPVDGELIAHAARCPHREGSLLDAAVDGSQLTCPWHGYRFELRSGACVSGPRCTLPRAPRVEVSAGRVLLRAS